MKSVRTQVEIRRTPARKCSAATAIASAIIIALVAGRSSGVQPSPHTAEIIKATGIDQGFCVQLGFDDGNLLLELAASGRFVVHGLDHDLETVDAVRRQLISEKCYGQVSVEHCSFKCLPHAENLVNLIVAEDLPALLAKGLDLQEVSRVLAPRGAICLGGGIQADTLKEAGFQEIRTVGRWTVGAKARPEAMDEWTHLQHGPDGNPVSRDALIEPPANLNWLHGPLWPNLGGRFLTDDGRNIYADGRRFLVRDAFNGLPLWSEPVDRDWRARPLLHAVVGTRAYLIDPQGTLLALDTRTGKRVLMPLKTKLSTSSTLVVVGQRLIVGGVDGVVCVDAHTGTHKWKSPTVNVRNLVVGEGRIFVMVGPSDSERRRGEGGPQRLHCLDLNTGGQQWHVTLASSYTNLLFVKYGLVLCHGQTRLEKPGHNEHRLYAYSGKDGKLAWTEVLASSSYHRFYAAQGLIWSMPRQGAKLQAIDPANGKMKKTLDGKGLTLQCSGSKGDPIIGGAATERYLIGNKLLEFVEMDTGKRIRCPVARNACTGTPGILLGNGLTYLFPKACQCGPFLRGYSAFSGESDLRGTELAARLERGPAYANSGAIGKEEKDSWPAYRHDARRSAATQITVPSALRLLWETQLEDQKAPEALRREWALHQAHAGSLTAPVIAGGMVLVAAPNSHRVFAVAADTGEQCWSFIADGRISAPPCVDGGLCYFGAQDGWVYCLRLKDGQLVWRFRAAPAQRRFMAFGQPESQWPVYGGVMVEDGRVYFAAGRHSYVSGGITGYAIEARSGKLLWKATTSGSDAHLRDLPVSDGQSIRLAHPSRTPWILNPKTGSVGHAGTAMLQSKEGLLDYTLFSQRISAPRGRPFMQRYGELTAQLLAFDGNRTFGFMAPSKSKERDANTRKYIYYPARVQSLSGPKTWSTEIKHKDLWTNSMILTADTLYLAGEAGDTGLLLALSADSGVELAKVTLPHKPRPEGLAAAYGKLYLATLDGKLLCFGR